MSFENLPKRGKPVGLFDDSFKRKASLGDDRLDILLKGGVSYKTTSLFISPNTKEKDIFLTQFIGSGLVSNEPVIIILTDKSPKEFMDDAKKRSWDLQPFLNRGLIHFIDCYSWTLGDHYNDTDENIIKVPGPSALNDLSISISQALSKMRKLNRPVRILFYSLSTLLLYNKEDVVFKFLQITGARLKSSGASSLFLIETKMHEDKTLTTLKHLTDDLFELSKTNNKWYLKSLHVPFQNGIPLKFGKKGVTVP